MNIIIIIIIKHMIYGELHKHHYLIWNKNASDNNYSSLLRHDICNVDHKMVILGINFCHNTLSHICMQHQNYPEHDTDYLSIFFA